MVEVAGYRTEHTLQEKKEMSYRRRRGAGDGDGDSGGGVKGPSSALTSFLREQGINAEEIRLRYERSQQQADGEIPEEEQGEVVATDANNTNDQETPAIPLNFALDSDEEELDDGDNDDNGPTIEGAVKRRKVHHESTNSSMIYCAECDQNFQVSVYSKN